VQVTPAKCAGTRSGEFDQNSDLSHYVFVKQATLYAVHRINMQQSHIDHW